jgi:hypothetical protein
VCCKEHPEVVAIKWGGGARGGLLTNPLPPTAGENSDWQFGTATETSMYRLTNWHRFFTLETSSCHIAKTDKLSLNVGQSAYRHEQQRTTYS